jgi:methionyl-tRNA formyltransferase
MARIVFMGTPQFAVPALAALDRHHQVVGVVTQPDSRAGRGRQVVASPVKEAALASKLPLFQPLTLNTSEAMALLADWQPEVIVVAAFGQLLRTPILTLPPYGCLNIHASLLPHYRGAAPIPAAILAGDPATGITLMRMDEGLDTGLLLAQARHPIHSGDTTTSLTAKLADLAAQLLIDTLPGWLSGEIQAYPQDDAQATYCSTLTKEDGRLDWKRPATYLDRQVRACDPWPGTYTTWQGQRLKILRARPRAAEAGGEPPGTVLALEPGVGVVTGQGLLELRQVQLAGKKAMAAGLFARGQQALIGSLLS